MNLLPKSNVPVAPAEVGPDPNPNPVPAGLAPNGLPAVLVVVLPNGELNTEEVVVVVVPKPNPEEVEAG